MALTALSNLLAPIAVFATAPILAQVLGVNGRGEVGAATAPLLLMTALATVGLPDAVTVFTARRPQMSRLVTANASFLLFVSGAVSTAIAVFLAPVFSGGAAGVRELTASAALAITPTLLIGALRGAAAGQHAWGLVNSEKLVSAAARLAATVLLAGVGYLNVGTATLIVALSPIIGGVAYVRLRTIRGPERIGHLRLSGQLLGFGSLLWVGSLSGVLLSRLDQVLMTPLAGVRELGYYVVAVSIAESALLANNAVRDVTLSADSSSSDDSRLGTSSRVSFLVSLMFGGFVVATMWWWLPFLFGRAFSPALPVTAILVLAAVAGVPGSVAGAGLIARGRPGLRSASLAIAALVNILLLFALAPALGAVGAAICTLAGSAIAANLNVFFIWHYFGIRPGALYLVNVGDVVRLSAVLLRIVRRKL
ncbi:MULTISPECIES: oligosaccharide flippase family protein [unclassified Cryobacterium]|uniref:oligosaccharide flippase family protein n=1 Tax=unclassified Cryobacterium TaxID=2649013 RepID=UPI0018CB7BDF|nr:MULTISPECIES: oligosaccharide flippase family protein [unclassified Cryobacterium]